MAMDGSDTSSEDEERIVMLRESVVNNTPKRNQEAEQFKQDKKKLLTSLPSLRPDKQQDTSTEEQLDSYYELTKGAKEYVAKKLAAYLDSELDTSASCFDAKPRDDSPEEGIRLYTSSIELTTNAQQEQFKPHPRRRKISSTDDSSSEDERLNEASVSHDFIIQQSQNVTPTNRVPADIIITNSDEKQNEIVMPTNRVPASTSISNTDDSFVTVNGESDREKKKKKKKKKKHKADVS